MQVLHHKRASLKEKRTGVTLLNNVDAPRAIPLRRVCGVFVFLWRSLM